MSGHHIDADNLTAQAFNPKTLLLSVMDELQPNIDSRGLTVNYIVDGVDNEVITFPDIVRQIMIDLLAVLIDSMRESVIEILLESMSSDSGALILMVEDKNRVVTAEELSNLFLVDRWPNLVRAKKLIKQLGGTLEVDSTAEMGTGFVMILPVQSLSQLDV